ncbi:MAG TPA: MFS transporter [Dehalococcoidia bacterium]|nr:MFS transporter [Dehalococcoidia bacterium]
MTHQNHPNGEEESRVARGRRAFDDAYRRAESFLDVGQGHAFRVLWFFLPETSVIHQVRFQAVFASRFFSDAGQQALAYGALVAVVRAGGSALDAALLGVAALLPPALFGLYGGAVADALPRRIALAVIYNAQALLCFAAPGLIGTELGGLMLLLFAVNLLGQVSGPSESAVVPLVASETQLASAASMLSLASSLGTAFGMALLAPILVRVFSVDVVIYFAGAMLLIAASRVFDLPAHASDPEDRLELERVLRKVSYRSTITWFARQPAVATMVFVAVLAGTAQIVVQTLAPRYVQAVLEVDAADAVYVFAPSALGLALAVIVTPLLVRRRGERMIALVGFVLVTASLCCFGLVADLTWIDPANPLRVLTPLGLDLELRLRTAALFALPLGFGLALTSISVQTYINRRVPLASQGRAFALQSSLKNGVAIIPLVALGLAAAEFGVASVLVASPFLLLALAIALLRINRYLAGNDEPGQLMELATYWEEPPALETPDR